MPTSIRTGVIEIRPEITDNRPDFPMKDLSVEGMPVS
jgi:hypothetical protein